MSKKRNKTSETRNATSLQDNLLNLGDFIKNLGNALLSMVGLTYACGFIIINLHLNRYGIYDFSILNARYVYTGFFFIVLCLMALSGGRVLERNLSKSQLSGILKLWILVRELLIQSGLFTLAVSALVIVVEDIKILSVFPINIWFNVAILTFASQIWIIKRLPSQNPLLSYPTSSIVTFLILASIFSTIYYPVLPFSLGGGRPTPIQLIIDGEKASFTKQVFDVKTNNISEVIYLLEQSPDMYYVLVKVDDKSDAYKSVQIDKSLIVGIIHPIEVNLPKSVIQPTLPKPTETPITPATFPSP